MHPSQRDPTMHLSDEYEYGGQSDRIYYKNEHKNILLLQISLCAM